ncbi:MAG TPA: ABC transporter substrate-binding protein [Terriglobales bacterium]|nr:ABC transporter substrate-binding protein [Terriglobales bacterium]
MPSLPQYVPQRVVALQPSVTSTLDRLGLLDRVVACTKWCVDVVPALRNHPRMIVADSWSAKSAEILEAQPDMVMASVPYQLDAVAEILKAGIPFMGFAPHSLHDVFRDIYQMAAVMGVAERGEELIAKMESEIATVRTKTEGAVAAANGRRPRVYCEEWGKPLIQSQGWVKELVEVAGGIFLGEAGAHTDEATVRAFDPDVILAAWCGAGDRVPLEKIIPARGWEQTTAARHGDVYCINDEYLNTPGPTLMQGLQAIAAALHPEAFPNSPGVRRIAAVEAGGRR